MTSRFGCFFLPGGPFFCLSHAIGLTLDHEDLRVVHQSVDNGDNAGRIREHLAPFGERPVGGHEGRFELVTAVDDVEQQIGVAIAVGEVTDFIE